MKNPSALYRLGSHNLECCVTTGYQEEWDEYSYALYQHLQKQNPEFEELAALQTGLPSVSVRREGDNGPARPLHAEFVSGNYFSLFGLHAVCGTPALAIR